jgi:Tfp pilus assembly protein PilF
MTDLTEAIRLKSDYELAYRMRAVAFEAPGEGERARQDERTARK